MKKFLDNIALGIFCMMLVIILSTMFFVACDVDDNQCNGREITKLYLIEKYKVHEVGVEIWAVSEDGEEKGFFVKHEKVFSYEEDDEGISRVIALCCSECDFVRDAYLYFSESDFKEYIKERYDIE